MPRIASITAANPPKSIFIGNFAGSIDDLAAPARAIHNVEMFVTHAEISSRCFRASSGFGIFVACRGGSATALSAPACAIARHDALRRVACATESPVAGIKPVSHE